jgi:DNA modification methylase
MMSYATARRRDVNSEINKLYPEDRAVHEWYRFVLSFPPHLVRTYLERFGITTQQTVLDPFCGTGTTLVECKKHGIPSVGIEANAMAHFASQAKTNWQPDPDHLMRHARAAAAAAQAVLDGDGIEDIALFPALMAAPQALRTLTAEQTKLLLANSISPLPLHKVLVLRDAIQAQQDDGYTDHELLAFAKTVVFAASNLTFGPEVGVGRPQPDAPVLAPWLAGMRALTDDLRQMHARRDVPAQVHNADARQIGAIIPPAFIDAVFTSPPYPNEKDYTRTTRLESVLLGFIHNKAELQALKRGLLRSNSRNVYQGDDDDAWVAQFPEIQRIAAEIEARRIALGKTSGFERMYARVTRLYFGGMARHFANLRPLLRPGAQLAYVVGDQASFLRVLIPTGTLLAEIAQSLGYEVVGIDLFRTRLATATKAQLREEVVVLRWPG